MIVLADFHEEELKKSRGVTELDKYAAILRAKNSIFASRTKISFKRGRFTLLLSLTHSHYGLLIVIIAV